MAEGAKNIFTEGLTHRAARPYGLCVEGNQAPRKNNMNAQEIENLAGSMISALLALADEYRAEKNFGVASAVNTVVQTTDLVTLAKLAQIIRAA